MACYGSIWNSMEEKSNDENDLPISTFVTSFSIIFRNSICHDISTPRSPINTREISFSFFFPLLPGFKSSMLMDK